MTVFVSGSGGFGKSKTLNELPPKVKEMLNKMMSYNNKIIVGDCQGIDTLVQQYCDQCRYDNVEIYYMQNKTGPRNKPANINPSWSLHPVASANNVSGRAYFAQKDRAMAKDANMGLALWDHISKGTETNINDMRNQNKPVLVYNIAEDHWDDAPEFHT